MAMTSPSNATPTSSGIVGGGGGGDVGGGGDGDVSAARGLFEQLLLPVVAMVCACIWLLFITYYLSRWWGFVLTKIANRFIKEGYLHIGSISFSVLSGKFMFRDLAYITADYAFRVQDGLLILRWWRQYQPMEDQADALQCVSRVYLLLNGLECHCYNVSSVYGDIEKSFQPKTEAGMDSAETSGSGDKRSKSTSLPTRPAALDWRDFIGVIKFDIHNGRIVFGNHFVPSVLILSIEDTGGSYTTRAPSAPWDFFMHEVLCEGEQFKVILAPSPKYEGPTDEPPRYMGEGFVVVQSNTLHFHYSQDEAGYVPLKNECGADELIPPCWALDVTCGAATNISYGPWADRQRDALLKFFFPQAYKTHEVTPKARPGQLRQFTSFEFRLNTVAEATIDILFSKDKETNAFHIDVDKASYVEVSIPLLIGSEGYHTRVTGQLLHVDSTTSMEYRSFIESETLQFQVAMHYPRVWNHHQNWEVTLTFSKASTYLLYAHKGFISDLVSDWSSKTRSDLFSFVPYTLHLNIILREFVLMLPTNKYNWVDCSSRQQQNVFISLVGDLLDLSVVLPYSDYLPPDLPVRVILRADSVSGRLYFPECYSSQHCLKGLDRSTKAPDCWMEDKKRLGLSSDSWQGITQGDEWVECAAVPYVAVSITYTYHPMPLEEDSPMIEIRRTPSGKLEHQTHPAQTGYAGWKRPGCVAIPSEWPADRLQLEVDIGPAIVMAYGSIVKCILPLKENYAGVDQVVTDFSRPPTDGLDDNSQDMQGRIVSGLALRPMEVIVSLNVDGIKATLPVYCGKAESLCPIAVLDQLCFELHKGHSETRLQLLLSPVTIMVSDSQKRVDSHLSDGHLGLSGLQLRGHAMFSDEGLPVDSETLEYAWLLDLQMGVLSGRLTPPQMLSLISFLQLFIHLAVDPLDDLQQPITSKLCVHMVKQQKCQVREPLYPSPCPMEEDFKYRMLRVSLRTVDVMLVETGCALQCQVASLNMGKCNLHSVSIGDGLSMTVQQIEVKQFVSQSDKSQVAWLQACSVYCPELQLDLADILQSKDSFKAQNHFLTSHDMKTKHLWFLWSGTQDEPLNQLRTKCGCRGGCLFFNGPKLNVQSNWIGDPSWKAPVTEVDYDYGQSILQQGQWIFSVCDRTPVDSPSREFKFTQGFVVGEVPSLRRASNFQVEAPDAVGSSKSLSQPIKEPSKRDSSSASVPDSQQQPSRNVSLSTSSAQASTTSDLALTVKTESDSSVFERQPYQWHGSSHSLPLEAMVLQAKLTLGRSNMSAEMIQHGPKESYMEPASASPTLVRSRDVPDLPYLKNTHGSISSHAESEYYSAEDEFTLNNTMSKTLVETPSSASFDINAPESSPSKSYADETLSSASTQQVESPESLQRQDETDMKRHSSSASYVSAASSESSFHPRKKTKEATLQSPTPQHPWASTKAYCHHLTLWGCSGWVTQPPGHTLHTQPPFSPLCAPAATLYKGNIPLPEFTVTQPGLRPGLVRMTDISQNEISSESESEDEDSADSEMFLGLPPQDMRRHNRVHSSPPTYQAAKAPTNRCQRSSTSAILNVQGALDVLLTPLLMLAIDRYLQSTENVLCVLHPEAIVDKLHMNCIGDVQVAFKEADKAASLKNSTESILSLSVTVPQVNLLVLQASTEYNHHQQQINQASLLVGCISKIQLQLMHRVTANQTDSNAPSPVDRRQKLEEIRMNSGSRYGLHTSDQETAWKNFKSSTVGQVTVSRVHCQLQGLDSGKARRSRHMSGVTSIPQSLSKVMFTLSPYAVSEDGDDVIAPASSGCSLMECGIEGITVHLSMECAPVMPQPSTAAPSQSHSRQPSQNWQMSPEFFSSDQPDHQPIPWGRARSVIDILPNPTSATELRHSDITLGVRKQAVKPSKSRIVDGKMVIASVWLHAPTPSKLSHEHSAGVQSGLNPVSALSLVVANWLPASQQAVMRMKSLKASSHLRVCAVMACIMAEAHEMTSTHYITAKSKYKRWTAETEAVDQDLSCQLFTTLWYYLHKSNPQRIEKLVSEDVPPILVLEQGTHALIRQWKVILSMLNPAVTAAQFPANRAPMLEEQTVADPLITTTLDANAPGHTLQTQYSGASVDLDAGAQDNASQLITQQGPDREDLESAKPYSSRYGTGYSMYEEFAGTSKALDLAEKFHEVPSNVLTDGTSDHTTRHRSQTTSSCTPSISGTPGKHQTLQASGQKLSIDSAEEGVEVNIEEPRIDETGIAGENNKQTYKKVPPPDLPFSLPYSYSFIPDAAITPTVMQLGDADILFKPLLKYLGIARKLPEHFIIKKNLQQTQATIELQRLSVTIVESSPRQRSRGRKSRDKESSRNKASFPSFSSEHLVLKLSVHECMDTGQQTPELGDRPLKPSPSDSSGPAGSQAGHCQALAAYVSLHWIRAMPVMNMPLLRLVSQLVQVGQAMQKAKRHLPSSKSGTDTEPSTMNSDLSATVLRQQATLPRIDSPDGPHGDTVSFSSQADSEVIAQCWQTMYHLKNLYSGVTQPINSLDTSRVIVNPLFRIENERATGHQSRDRGSTLEYRRLVEDLDEPDGGLMTKESKEEQVASSQQPLHVSVLCTVLLEELCIVSQLAGLQSEAELNNVTASITTKHIVPVPGSGRKQWSQRSALFSCDEVIVVLSERVKPNPLCLVTFTLLKPQASCGAASLTNPGSISASFSLQSLDASLPINLSTLHGVIERSQRKLTHRIKELQSALCQPQVTSDEADTEGDEQGGQGGDREGQFEPERGQSTSKEHVSPDATYIIPMSTSWRIVTTLRLNNICLQAAVLSSLKAQYIIHEIKGTSSYVNGVTKFGIEMPQHGLKFTSKVQDEDISSSAEMDLPCILFSGQYILPKQPDQAAAGTAAAIPSNASLDAVVTIEALRHSISTSLVNHLITVHNVFLTDLLRLVDDVFGIDESHVPVQCDTQTTPASTDVQEFDVSLLIRLNGVQITATTPSASAMRLETGVVEVQLSNRMTGAGGETISEPGSMKLYAKALIDLNISLGTMQRSHGLNDVDPELHQLAYFKANIGLTNAPRQHSVASSLKGEKAAFLVTLTKPLIYLQPSAVDIAVLVWVCYHSAYEQWQEQQKETSGSRVLARSILHRQATSMEKLSSVFLQLTLQDFGICVPINPTFQNISSLSGGMPEPDYHAALVLTLESSLITACYNKSLVTKGFFQTFCLRFAEDFNTSQQNWKPLTYKGLMNACVVPQGTLELCSRTISADKTDQAQVTNAGKWMLNFLWRMEGFDVQINPTIGRQLSALANTLTALAGDDDEVDVADLSSVAEPQDEPDSMMPTSDESKPVLRRPTSLFVSKQDAKRHSKMVMQEMTEQAKIVSDLRSLGAKKVTIAEEAEKLRQLEAAVFNDFRRDIRKRLRMQTMKASLRSKLTAGLPKSPSGVQRHPSISGRSASQAMPVTPMQGPKPFPKPGYKTPIGKRPQVISEYPTHPSASHVTFNIPRTTPSPLDELPPFISIQSEPRRRIKSIGSPEYLELNTTISDPMDADRDLAMAASSRTRRRLLQLHSSSVPEEMDSDSEGTDHEEDTSATSLTQSWSRSRSASGQRRGRTTLQPDQQQQTPISPAHSTKVEPPSVDFELDVKFNIDSGMLVLNSHGVEEKDDVSLIGRAADTRRPPGLFDDIIASHIRPGPTRHSSSNIGDPRTAPSKESIFYLPAFDIKLHYESSTSSGTASRTSESERERETQSTAMSGMDTSSTEGSIDKKTQHTSKQAVLYTWFMLTSPPKEVVVSLSLLDFLEEALETVPTSTSTTQVTDLNKSVEDIAVSANSLVSSSTMDSSTFPVDVVVYVCLRPSVICLSCLPVSKVECLLKLPTVEFAFSSRGNSQAEQMLAESASSMESSHISSTPKGSRVTVGGDALDRIGLSIAAVMSDFSLYVFHPYGGTQRRERVVEEMECRTDGGSDDSSVPWANLARKDALSLKVEFIKINMSRSRKLVTIASASAASIDQGVETLAGTRQENYQERRDADSSFGQRPLSRLQQSPPFFRDDRPKSPVLSASPSTSQNNNQFSILCDIGTAAFKYDMRRLTEMMAFPKAWYRKSIIKRLFLGEEQTAQESDDQLSSASVSSSATSSDYEDDYSPQKLPHMPKKHTPTSRRDFPFPPPSPSVFSIQSSHHSSSVNPEAKGVPSPAGLKHQLAKAVHPSKPEGFVSLPPDSHHHSGSGSGTSSSAGGTVKGGPSWHTSVRVGVNFTKLDIHMNMSNVMGSTVWSTTDLRTQGCVSIDSIGRKEVQMCTGLKQSTLEAKGGVIGGQLVIEELGGTLSHSQQPSHAPSHKLAAGLALLTLRIDYMGSSIIMQRLDKVHVHLNDEWKLAEMKGANTSHSRSSSVYLDGQLEWDTFQLMLSRSSTPDLIKMTSRLEEFFSQQFQSSKRMLASWQLGGVSSQPSSEGTRTESESSSTRSLERLTVQAERNYHRHWQPAFSLLKSYRSNSKLLPPQWHAGNLTLGGHVLLSGNRAMLACFHGINFRASSWALFTLQEPELHFETEAVPIKPSIADGQGGTNIIEDLVFNLGHNQTERGEGSMGVIYRVTRTERHHFPTNGTIDQCFHYVYAIKAPEEFEHVLTSSSMPSYSSKETFRHTAEPIFALPKLQLEMKSNHMQSTHSPALNGPPQAVTVSFVTHFTDHINVAMDIELILFLHAFVTAYISYKDKATPSHRNSVSSRPTMKAPTDQAALHLPEPAGTGTSEVTPSSGASDWREFQCTTWQLEPTIRLLSWGGKQIEPLGVDYILQKLGFSHARVTIPKWMQRGTMDPLDKTVALLMERLIKFIKETD